MQAGYEFLMCTPPLSLPFATAQGWLSHWGSLAEKDGEWERLYFGGTERRMRLVFSSFVLENNDTQSNLNVSSGPENAVSLVGNENMLLVWSQSRSVQQLFCCVWFSQAFVLKQDWPPINFDWINYIVCWLVNPIKINCLYISGFKIQCWKIGNALWILIELITPTGSWIGIGNWKFGHIWEKSLHHCISLSVF